MSIAILHGALDKRDDGDIVLRGVIEPAALGIHPSSPALVQGQFQIGPQQHGRFLVDDYQREIMPGAKRDELVKAFVAGQRIPDVELGMRGNRIERRSGRFYLFDDVYIVDGLQRIAAACTAWHTCKESGGVMPHLGATIYFNSTSDWERAQFRTLNMDRTKLSPNIHLRNLRPTHRSTAMLYKLSTAEQDFALYQRVQWGQQAKVGEFITALGLYRVVSMLHWQFGTIRGGNAMEFASSLERVVDSVGIRRLHSNTTTFFSLVDECWGTRQLAYSQSAPHVKQSFLVTLAELFTRHKEFWRNERDLFVDAPTKRKLAKFPLRDSGVRDLISSSGAGNQRMLYHMLLEHVNKGRRSNRLTEMAMPEEDE